MCHFRPRIGVVPCRSGASRDGRSRKFPNKIAKYRTISIQDLRLSRRRPRVRVPSTPPTILQQLKGFPFGAGACLQTGRSPRNGLACKRAEFDRDSSSIRSDSSRRVERNAGVLTIASRTYRALRPKRPVVAEPSGCRSVLDFPQPKSIDSVASMRIVVGRALVDNVRYRGRLTDTQNQRFLPI